jgi:hypothetical protein
MKCALLWETIPEVTYCSGSHIYFTNDTNSFDIRQGVLGMNDLSAPCLYSTP